MTVIAVSLWSIWSAFALFFAVLHIYRSSLGRDEEDQIFLDDSFEQEKAAQAVITAKVARIDPWIRIATWLLAGMSVLVVVYYIRDVLLQLNIIH
jgi:hypothetical protein